VKVIGETEMPAHRVVVELCGVLRHSLQRGFAHERAENAPSAFSPSTI
jgi:hypothetical protein